MHIPDGYLSPSTCAALYGGTVAAWYVCLKRLKRVLLTRVVPLISVFAAFEFVVMMFNLPLPGGTTGHALGVTIATIVLGPAGAVMATSLAIALQALLFGDGGITTLGANCFNMAVIGSLVAYGCYRTLAARAPITARRRVVAAGVAGYLAANVSALAAAVELGIQPALFHDAGGAPLYAPYPLKIAIPAMMIGHLTFAGIAEALISAGLVAYLQAADASLLAVTSGSDVPAMVSGGRTPASLRRLWVTVALLLMLTPLGILATGKAWGEWAPSDFLRPAARTQIAQASRNTLPPAAPPGGMARLATIWTSPFPAYAPAFVRSRTLGYLLSAMFGVGVCLLIALLAQSRLRAHPRPEQVT
ncbi:MAG: cobalt transporter CbiM [Candidatus Korobacteraceae bacterium]